MKWHAVKMRLCRTICIVTICLLSFQHFRSIDRAGTESYPQPEPKLLQSLHVDEVEFAVCGSPATLVQRLEWLKEWWQGVRGFVWLPALPSPDLQTQLSAASVKWQVSSLHPHLHDNCAGCQESRSSKYCEHCRDGDAAFFADGGQWGSVRCTRMPTDAWQMAHNSKTSQPPKWLILADDDTFISVPNILTVLSKFDANVPHYIGGISEVKQQLTPWDMAFGGGGVAMSAALVSMLNATLDSCLEDKDQTFQAWWTHDHALAECIEKLGVRRTNTTFSQGFHQLDLVGDLRGLLEAHPVVPLISLHHMNRFLSLQEFQHIAGTIRRFPSAALQQTICHHHGQKSTIAIAAGFSLRWWDALINHEDLIVPEMTFRTDHGPPFSHHLQTPQIFTMETRLGEPRTVDSVDIAVATMYHVAHGPSPRGNTVTTIYRTGVKLSQNAPDTVKVIEQGTGSRWTVEPFQRLCCSQWKETVEAHMVEIVISKCT